MALKTRMTRTRTGQGWMVPFERGRCPRHPFRGRFRKGAKPPSSLLPDGIAHPHPALDGDHIRRPLEGRRRRRARLAGAADGLEEMLEAGGETTQSMTNSPGPSLMISCLTSWPRKQAVPGTRSWLLPLTITGPGREADLELDLVVVGVLADAPAGRDGLEAHGETSNRVFSG